MNINQLKIRNKVYFEDELLPYKIMAVNDNYMIASRKLNARQDVNLIKYRVEMGAYMSFKEAYNDLKHSPVYTIVDLNECVRGSDNMIFGQYDYFSEFDCAKAIQALENGEMEISRRSKISL